MLVLVILALVALGAGAAASGISRLAAFAFILAPIIAVFVVVYLRKNPSARATTK